MKNILWVLILIALLPFYSFAHGGSMMSLDELQTGPEMMEYLEESALGDDLHEEMERLMTRMMSGALTQGEAERMTELMGQYPGPYGMMMVRLSSPQVNQFGWGSGWNMMGGWNGSTGLTTGGMMGWGGLWFWIFTLSWLVWTAAGVLLVIWLAKKMFSGR